MQSHQRNATNTERNTSTVEKDQIIRRALFSESIVAMASITYKETDKATHTIGDVSAKLEKYNK